MGKLINHNRYYFIAVLLVWITACWCLAVTDDKTISITLNSLHMPWLDQLCQYGTHFGDGLFFAGICLVLLFIDKRLAITFLAAYLLSGGITQGLKHFVFNDSVRPSLVLDMSRLHVVQGLELHEFNSFPSGHATSIFALVTITALYSPNKIFAALLVVPGLFVAFTRIYLLQHFFSDTLAGSVIGVTCAFVIFYARQKINKNGAQQA